MNWAPSSSRNCFRAPVSRPAEVDEVILGQVLTAAQGQNPARQASINAGLPKETTAWGLNQVCGSGLRAIALGMQQIATGDAKVIIAGGQESMSLSAHAQHLRAGVKMGDYKMIDTMIKDGLWDAFNGYHMGNTAENVARQFQITREEQDQFALASQNKAEAAQKAGKFKDEIVAVTVKGRKGDTIVDPDEYIRHGATLDAMQKLKPAFDKDGTVTAANASGINDGAAGALLMTEDEAVRRGITPLVRIVSWATAGVDPAIMGTGPIPASKRARWKKPAGRSRTSTWSRPTRPSPRRPAPSTRAWAGTRTSSTSMAARSPSAIRSALPAPASSTRWFLRCAAAAPRRAWRRSASAAAWASRCAWKRCKRRMVNDEWTSRQGRTAFPLSAIRHCTLHATSIWEENTMARTALVTGGSRGIGAAISVALKNAGYNVAANYAGNDEAAAEIQGRNRHPGL